MSETATTETATTTANDRELEQLRRELRKTQADLADTQEELKSTRAEARDRRHDVKSAKEQLEALAKERDQFKAQAALDPENLRAQLAEATGKIRERAHRDVFTEVARAAKVTDPARIADLYALSGYKPEGDEADRAKLGEVIAGALKGRPHFLDAPAVDPPKTAAGAAGATQTQPGGKPGPGAERGQSTSSESSSPARERIPGRL